MGRSMMSMVVLLAMRTGEIFSKNYHFFPNSSLFSSHPPPSATSYQMEGNLLNCATIHFFFLHRRFSSSKIGMKEFLLNNPPNLYENVDTVLLYYYIPVFQQHFTLTGTLMFMMMMILRETRGSCQFTWSLPLLLVLFYSSSFSSPLLLLHLLQQRRKKRNIHFRPCCCWG